MTPLQLVETQVNAYNMRDVDRFCAVFADDIVAYSLKDDKVLIKGMKAFRETYSALFAESPKLHAKIVKRMQVGDFIIDEEEVSGRRGQNVHAVAIYRITGQKISHVWFAM